MKNTYLRGELYYADLGTGIGSEQNGYRPVVIIQNDVGNRHSPTTIVAAISTQIRTKANLPTHYHLKPGSGLVQPSMVMLQSSIRPMWLPSCPTSEVTGKAMATASARLMKRLAT